MGMGHKTIDLNADLGEQFAPEHVERDMSIMQIVSSANIACGGHASDKYHMRETVLRAKDAGLSIGAHPGFPDPENFGRVAMQLSTADLRQTLQAQISDLRDIAAAENMTLSYVKLHGAMANMASSDIAFAAQLAEILREDSPNLPVLVMPNVALAHALENVDQPHFFEIYADRAYQSDGTLAPRSEKGAVLNTVAQVCDQMAHYLDYGEMVTRNGAALPLSGHSICLHSDTPGALKIARTVAQLLLEKNIDVQPFG